MSYTFVFIKVVIESKKEVPLALEKAMVVKSELWHGISEI